MAMIESSCPYVVRDGIIFRVEEMTRAADLFVSRSWTVSLAPRWVGIFEVSIIKIYSALLRQAAAEPCKNVPVTEKCLTFLRSGYLM